MWKILVALCLAQTAEAWLCQCGLFADSQIDPTGSIEGGSFPLWAEAIDVTDGFVDLCGADLDAATASCQDACQVWFDSNYGEEFGYCFRSPDGTSRCYGGLFCENLQSEQKPDIESESVNMFHRVGECQAEFVNSGSALALPLCCASGLWVPCDEAVPTCDCYGGDGDLCECGVFSPDQFEPTPGPPIESEPLPVAYVGADSSVNDSASFCTDFGSTTDECRMLCETSADSVTVTLDSDYPNAAPGVTYGDAYCAGLAARGYILDNTYQTDLQVYQRAPTCPDVEGWILVPGTVFDEPLCCDVMGNHRSGCAEATAPPPPATVDPPIPPAH